MLDALIELPDLMLEVTEEGVGTLEVQIQSVPLAECLVDDECDDEVGTVEGAGNPFSWEEQEHCGSH